MDNTTPRAAFTNANRHISEEEELILTSVGVDIGSSTSHLVYSRLELKLEATRYRVTRREILNESEILLTRYVDETKIDVEALEAFINRQYKKAKIKRDEVDTGALILTGVAVRRRNARAIAELFAAEAGKFVAVSAGDGLEATMAAHGSGAVAHSEKMGGVVLNIDVGGGTSKFAICNNGKVQEVSAIDICARLLSGGVSEFIYNREKTTFGDLGPLIAQEVHRRMADLEVLVMEPAARIRATVIGASQYTVQVSGNTVFISPENAVPVRNVAVVAPEFPLNQDDFTKDAVRDALLNALRRLDLLHGRQPVAVAFHWDGSATFLRLQACCSGVAEGLKDIFAKGHPLILVNDGDIGGIVGLHFQEELQLQNPIISIDGIALSDFDYIDIGALIESSGAVPVVIKSLIFPSSPQQ